MSKLAFLGGVAFAAAISIAPLAHAADADVDGMDHSKLAHGVLGPEPAGGAVAAAPAAAPAAPAAAAPAPAPAAKPAAPIIWKAPTQ